MGSATLFDAFDALSLAFVLPVLVGLWESFSWPDRGADRRRLSWPSCRRVGLRLGCRAPWAGAKRHNNCRCHVGNERQYTAFTGNLHMLFLMRFLQGIGVGGEVPVAATYINELSSSAWPRTLLYSVTELIFPLGSPRGRASRCVHRPTLWLGIYVPDRRNSRHRRHDPDRTPSGIAALAHFSWTFG